jgi:DNA helicase HerA-like ATPase
MSEKLKDKRFDIFCSPIKLDLFHSITHHNQIWRPDLYDVKIIHRESRECFEHLLNRVHSQTKSDSGRILLLLGESGAGKTHLMRAFRNHTHEHGLGYFVYMQANPNISKYEHYALHQAVDSLDKPYYQLNGDLNGFLRLSNALIEQDAIPKNKIQHLRNSELSQENLAILISEIADIIINQFCGQDLDLIRALLYLQCDNAAIHARVFKYLRCEHLVEYDSKVLGGLSSQDNPLNMLEALAKLMLATNSGAFIICLDELERIQLAEDAKVKFPLAIDTLIKLADKIPNFIGVVACLVDFYETFKNTLQTSQLDRIRSDPRPSTLITQCNQEEVQAIIEIRLQDLFNNEGIEFDKNDPICPFPPETPEKLAGMNSRKVLDWCREQREQSMIIRQHPRLPNDTELTGIEPIEEPVIDALWNNHLNRSHSVPENEFELLQLLASSIEHCTKELNYSHQFQCLWRQGFLDIGIQDATGNTSQQLTIGLCQKSSQGGSLAKQIDQLQAQAGVRKPIALRSTEFPSNPQTQIAKRLGEFIAVGGKRIVVFDSDWRTMVAMTSFRLEYENHPKFLEWLRAEQPLLSLPSLQQILNIENSDPPPLPDPVLPVIHPTDPSLLRIGFTQGYQPRPYEINRAELVRHAAFLGSPGSGKTTLALNIIEQLLLQGIPAILLDRKGDLCNYAQEAAWQTPITDPERAKMRDKLHAKTEIVIYTPGTIEGQGRALNIPIAPNGLGQLPSGERQQLANHAAFALGKIMGYRDSGQDKSRTAILGQAIALLSELQPDQALSLDSLMNFIDSEDPLLLNAIGKLDSKLFKKLVEDLQTLNLTNGNLFSQHGESLNAQSLLGLSLDKHTGRTRLSIINTAFLGNDENILFWVAQFLLEISRYAKKSPSDKLQAVILFDEADLYLPAQSKPVTKDPLENLLRRARSAGLGLMLATQSPGDLDYKSRDQISSWFIGRVTQNTALDKLRPLLSEVKTDIPNKLPNQATGEFYAIHNGEVDSFKADLSLIQTKQVSSDEILKLASNKTENSPLSRFRTFLFG